MTEARRNRFILLMLTCLALPASIGAAGLDAGILATAAAEPDLDEADVMAAVNRWSVEIYGDHPHAAQAYAWACQLDPVTAEIAAAWREAMKDAGSVAEKVAAIDAWNEANMCHTQMQPQFAEEPGRDPWGLTTEGGPTFRKLLPSEMKAMRRLTGKISGKCMTHANLLIGALAQVGVAPEDLAVVHVNTGSYHHGAALLRWDGEMVRTNNHRIGMHFGEGYREPYPPLPTPILALYNHRFFNGGGFELPIGALNRDVLDPGEPLMPQLVEICRKEAPIPEADADPGLPFADPEKLRARIFGADDLPEGPTPWLARYAYQSLYVKHPEHYLRASLREPHARELAAELDGATAMLGWMHQNLEGESIFPDADERVMTADQVIVFRTGGPLDRAVLLWTLLRHDGVEAEVVLGDGTAYVHSEPYWCDMRTLELAPPVTDPALTISLP